MVMDGDSRLRDLVDDRTKLAREHVVVDSFRCCSDVGVAWIWYQGWL